MSEITIKDIARECGVGISTVSRAINNHADINPETKRMVMQKIKETGYIPNNSARNLKRTDARCIAVLIKGITIHSLVRQFRLWKLRRRKKDMLWYCSM